MPDDNPGKQTTTSVSPAVKAAVRGAEYPSGPGAFGNIFWKHGWVLGTRAGLLISLVNN